MHFCEWQINRVWKAWWEYWMRELMLYICTWLWASLWRSWNINDNSNQMKRNHSSVFRIYMLKPHFWKPLMGCQRAPLLGGWNRSPFLEEPRPLTAIVRRIPSQGYCHLNTVLNTHITMGITAQLRRLSIAIMWILQGEHQRLQTIFLVAHKMDKRDPETQDCGSHCAVFHLR